MKQIAQVVPDTNILVSALKSKRGASYRLLWLIDSGKFEVNLSVPLFLEYEAATKRLLGTISLASRGIDDILDYVLACANRHQIHYLWRPVLSDPKDEMVLELAVAAACDRIVTYNVRDFEGAAQFGIRVMRPQAFLREIGEIP